ncbi:hypothetical protein EJ04DRAFT_360577 [Polyplosphaeria fusca]|uniref:Secreted protein n=1 Tax=Polyplosphaeria fusca TaxID=682080 RepID=A0A9P4UX97_9PLEO|nr:hypothetical protein EJ04DRAFT_360577 [Polyplosphaeria fusca]
MHHYSLLALTVLRRIISSVVPSLPRSSRSVTALPAGLSDIRDATRHPHQFPSSAEPCTAPERNHRQRAFAGRAVYQQFGSAVTMPHLIRPCGAAAPSLLKTPWHLYFRPSRFKT